MAALGSPSRLLGYFYTYCLTKQMLLIHGRILLELFGLALALVPWTILDEKDVLLSFVSCLVTSFRLKRISLIDQSFARTQYLQEFPKD